MQQIGAEVIAEVSAQVASRAGKSLRKHENSMVFTKKAGKSMSFAMRRKVG